MAEVDPKDPQLSDDQSDQVDAKQKPQVEFQIDDLVNKLTPGDVGESSCGGCHGCTGCSM
jgi:hypothetical protein